MTPAARSDSRPVSARLFVSWCHSDEKLKQSLMAALTPHLKIAQGVRMTWWQDQDAHVGVALTPEVLAQLDACHYGLLLLSPSYFASDFITEHELPRFIGPGADKPMIPVDLRRVPLDGSHSVHGIEERLVFRHKDKSFNRCAGVGRDDFALELSRQIRRRILHDHGLDAA